MKTYVLKMQWLFNANAEDLKNCFSVIKAIGARSLTEVTFRDSNLNIIGSYSSMRQYLSSEGTKRTIKAIKNAVKADKNICAIELYRTN